MVELVADGAGEELGALKDVFLTLAVERLCLDVIGALYVSRAAGEGKTALAALLLARGFNDLGIDQLINLAGLGFNDYNAAPTAPRRTSQARWRATAST